MTEPVTEPVTEPATDTARAARVVGELRSLLATGELELPLPGRGATSERWAALQHWGRRDLVLARLAEGHTDALAILAEAGHEPAPGRLYGVWAARSGGTGTCLEDGRLRGTVRFCSGAHGLDRALVVAARADESVLVEVDLQDPRVVRRPETWQPLGMAASDSPDVEFDGLPVDETAVVGSPGFYVGRPGFALGAAGVAAVWTGGAQGVLDAVVGGLAERPSNPHQEAHLGALETSVEAARCVLGVAAARVDAGSADLERTAATCRAVAERAAWDVHDRVPRITGPTPLCRDRAFAQRLADLGVYVRQHHAEADLAALGRTVLDRARDGRS